jgi:ParB/RepB/Spo0J family partition protein
MRDVQPLQRTLLPETPPEFCAEEVSLDAMPADAAILGAPPDPALVASIRQHGVLQPVLLVRTERETLWVAEGRRRIKAARLAGAVTIPAWITDGDDGLAAAFGLVTHGTRRDNPAAELAAIEQLLALGASEQAIARETGLRLATIRQRLRLRQLDPNLHQAFRLGRLAIGVAEQAAKLPAIAQARLATKLKEAGKVTATDVAAERQVRREDAATALPFTLLTAVPSTDPGAMPAPPASDAVAVLTAWLEAVLPSLANSPIREVAAFDNGTLLVQLRDGSTCTVQVSAGVPNYAEVA